MNDEIDYKELYETQYEEFKELEEINYKLFNELKENEKHYDLQKESMQMRLGICFFIGGIIAYLMFNCFVNFDDWSLGLSVIKIVGKILIEILIGAAYSFCALISAIFLFIFIKDASSKKSVTIRLIFTILIVFIIVPIIESILF